MIINITAGRKKSQEIEGNFVFGAVLGEKKEFEIGEATEGSQFIVGKAPNPSILVAMTKKMIEELGKVFENSTGMPAPIFNILLMSSKDWHTTVAKEEREDIFDEGKEEGESND